MLGARALAFWLAAILTSAAAVAQQEIIVSIRVQGNTLTPDDEIVRIAGVSEGAPLSDNVLAQAAERLRATKRFERVEVAKRYASLADPTQILILIRVDEGPVRVVQGNAPGRSPRVVSRSGINLMFVPILDAEDGYGITYGIELGLTGRHATSRAVFPLSWGGDKRAGAEIQKEFASRLAPRTRGGVFIQRRTHPFFRSDAQWRRVWARAEWRPFAHVLAGTELALQRATMLVETDTTRSIAADAVIDTRTDPLLPRNAIYARAAVERLVFVSALPPKVVTRAHLEAVGYASAYRGSVFVLRALREDTNRTIPPFFKSLLGGSENLRGFEAGTAVGDTLAAGSLEWKIPLTSAVHLARFGASVFLDAGAVYDKDERLAHQRFKRGVGGGVWAGAALFRISLMVAHGIGAGTRVHFSAGLTF